MAKTLKLLAGSTNGRTGADQVNIKVAVRLQERLLQRKLKDRLGSIAPSMVRFRQTGLRDGLWPETRHLQRDLRSTKNRARRASVDSPNGGSGPTENCLRLRKKTSSEPARTLLPVAGDCDIVPFGLPSIVVDRQGALGNL